MKEAKFEQIVEALRLKSEGYSWVAPAIAQIVLQYSRQEPLATNTTTDNKTVLINRVRPRYDKVFRGGVSPGELYVKSLLLIGYLLQSNNFKKL